MALKNVRGGYVRGGLRVGGDCKKKNTKTKKDDQQCSLKK